MIRARMLAASNSDESGGSASPPEAATYHHSSPQMRTLSSCHDCELKEKLWDRYVRDAISVAIAHCQ